MVGIFHAAAVRETAVGEAMSAMLDRWERDANIVRLGGELTREQADRVLALIAVARAAAEVYRPYSKARDGASVQGTRHKALRAALAASQPQPSPAATPKRKGKAS